MLTVLLIEKPWGIKIILIASEYDSCTEGVNIFTRQSAGHEDGRDPVARGARLSIGFQFHDYDDICTIVQAIHMYLSSLVKSSDEFDQNQFMDSCTYMNDDILQVFSRYTNYNSGSVTDVNQSHSNRIWCLIVSSYCYVKNGLTELSLKHANSSC